MEPMRLPLYQCLLWYRPPNLKWPHCGVVIYLEIKYLEIKINKPQVSYDSQLATQHAPLAHPNESPPGAARA
jgi:hypothetical protein